MVIIFIGPPGSGKGTQAKVLKDSILPNLHILTVSSLLKEKSSDGSVLGNEIKQKIGIYFVTYIKNFFELYPNIYKCTGSQNAANGFCSCK